MQLTANTYVLILQGQVMGTASYQFGLLRSVHLDVSDARDVAAVMALLPSREANLGGPDSLLGAVDINAIVNE